MTYFRYTLKTLTKFALLIVLSQSVIPISEGKSDPQSEGQKIQENRFAIDGDTFLRDGKPFQVRGACYSPVYPGESNRSKPRAANIASDFAKMREIGINTINLYRTLDAQKIYPEAAKQDLAILQGIWIDQEVDNLQESRFKKAVKRRIKNAIDNVHKLRGGDYTSTILGFWLGGELDPYTIEMTDARSDVSYYEGKHYKIKNASPTECFFAEMCDFGREYAIQTYGRSYFFSHINWPPTEKQFDLSFLDFLMFDVYSFWPFELTKYKPGSYSGTSYQGYLEDLRRQYKGVPLIISEFGYSTAPENTNEAGNNQRDQAIGLAARWHDIITVEPPIAGGCIFEWNDEWSKQSASAKRFTRNEDFNYHQRDDSEEWFGIMQIDGPSKSNYKVEPKEGFYATKRFYSDKFSSNRHALEPFLLKNLPKPVRSKGSSSKQYRCVFKNPIDINDKLFLSFSITKTVPLFNFKIRIDSADNFIRRNRATEEANEKDAEAIRLEALAQKAAYDLKISSKKAEDALERVQQGTKEADKKQKLISDIKKTFFSAKEKASEAKANREVILKAAAEAKKEVKIYKEALEKESKRKAKKATDQRALAIEAKAKMNSPEDIDKSISEVDTEANNTLPFGIVESVSRFVKSSQKPGQDHLYINIPLEAFGPLDFSQLKSITLFINEEQPFDIEKNIAKMGFYPNRLSPENVQ